MSGQTMSGQIAETLTVALGDRAYEIVIGDGLLASAAVHIAPLLPRKNVFVVTDDQVGPLYLATLCKSLEATGISVASTTLPAGEAHKNMATLEKLLDDLQAAKVDRSDMIIALGGGVIGDMTGFAASILRRGVDFIQIPTTLLAQVDSSVGGKTGIDTRFGKNLVGAFHQPRLVLADTSVLDTLPARQLQAGYAEVVKYGLINDADFFDWCEQNGADALSGDAAARRHAILESCRHKADIVARDETESGDRALLNLGHTFAHALEAAAGFDDVLLHGEAVALGMVLAFNLSAEMGLAPAADAQRVKAHLDSVGLRTSLSHIKEVSWDADDLVRHMTQDKKMRAGSLTFVLTHGIGQAFLQPDMDLSKVRDFLADHIAA